MSICNSCSEGQDGNFMLETLPQVGCYLICSIWASDGGPKGSVWAHYTWLILSCNWVYLGLPEKTISSGLVLNLWYWNSCDLLLELVVIGFD